MVRMGLVKAVPPVQVELKFPIVRLWLPPGDEIVFHVPPPPPPLINVQTFVLQNHNCWPRLTESD